MKKAEEFGLRDEPDWYRTSAGTWVYGAHADLLRIEMKIREAERKVDQLVDQWLQEQHERMRRQLLGD